VELRRRILLFLVLTLCVSVPAASGEEAAEVVEARFFDPYRLFQLTIPSGWIFQAGESGADLLVFYGPEHEQLLYIEYFPEIAFSDPMVFADKVTGHYGAEYGLKGFQLLTGPFPAELDGITAAQVEYSYLGRKERTEYRIFVIVDQMGLTITFSDARPHYAYSKRQFDAILASFGWEVGK
jgi:hypothetical protein